MEENNKTCGTCAFFFQRVEGYCGYCVNKNASIYVANRNAEDKACRLHTPEETEKTDD